MTQYFQKLIYFSVSLLTVSCQYDDFNAVLTILFDNPECDPLVNDEFFPIDDARCDCEFPFKICSSASLITDADYNNPNELFCVDGDLLRRYIFISSTEFRELTVLSYSQFDIHPSEFMIPPKCREKLEDGLGPPTPRPTVGGSITRTTTRAPAFESPTTRRTLTSRTTATQKPIVSSAGEALSMDDSEEGKDWNSKCCEWVSQGECDSNPQITRTVCQKSCGTKGCKAEKWMYCTVKVNLSHCDSDQLQILTQNYGGGPSAQSASKYSGSSHSSGSGKYSSNQVQVVSSGYIRRRRLKRQSLSDGFELFKTHITPPTPVRAAEYNPPSLSLIDPNIDTPYVRPVIDYDPLVYPYTTQYTTAFPQLDDFITFNRFADLKSPIEFKQSADKVYSIPTPPPLQPYLSPYLPPGPTTYRPDLINYSKITSPVSYKSTTIINSYSDSTKFDRKSYSPIPVPLHPTAIPVYTPSHSSSPPPIPTYTPKNVTSPYDPSSKTHRPSISTLIEPRPPIFVQNSSRTIPTFTNPPPTARARARLVSIDPYERQQQCRDLLSVCVGWASNQGCYRNPRSRVVCPKSCHMC